MTHGAEGRFLGEVPRTSDLAPPPVVTIMPGAMTSMTGMNRAEPLTEGEAQSADRVARRIHEQMRSFLGALPMEARNASGLARFLNVDRTTCQRLVFTASRPYPGLELIDRLPGVRGLRQLIEAAGRNEAVSEDQIAPLEAAVDRFEQALRSLAGSQSALVRRINAGAVAAGHESPPVRAGETGSARQRLFEVAAELTGRYSETWVAVYAYFPTQGNGGDPDQTVTVARAHGLIGHLARPDAVPLTFHNFTSKRMQDGELAEADQQSFRSLNDGRSSGKTPDAVLTPFTTDPPPIVSSGQPGEYLVQAIDTDPRSGNEPIDLMLGTRSTMPHPGSQPPGIEEVWAMINFPVRRMVFDVYMHRDLARECIPALDLHLWRPDFAAHVGDRWQTRFADAPRLELLGQGIDRAATAAYERHEDLTRFLFQRLEREPGRFIGYRCYVEYPIWRTGYCMSFDFNAEAES